MGKGRNRKRRERRGEVGIGRREREKKGMRTRKRKSRDGNRKKSNRRITQRRQKERKGDRKEGEGRKGDGRGEGIAARGDRGCYSGAGQVVLSALPLQERTPGPLTTRRTSDTRPSLRGEKVQFTLTRCPALEDT